MTEIIKSSALAFIIGIASSYAFSFLTKWYSSNRRISWRTVTNGIKILIRNITNTFQPEVVLGLGRSGSIIGAILAGNLGGIPFLSQIVQRNFVGEGKMKRRVTVFSESINWEDLKGKKVLLVICSNITGGDLNEWLSKHEQIISANNIQLETACLFQSGTSLVKADYYALDVEEKNVEIVHTKLPWMLTEQYKHSHRPK